MDAEINTAQVEQRTFAIVSNSSAMKFESKIDVFAVVESTTLDLAAKRPTHLYAAQVSVASSAELAMNLRSTFSKIGACGRSEVGGKLGSYCVKTVPTHRLST